MPVTTRRYPTTSLLSCDFSNQERSAAATLRTPAATASERSWRTPWLRGGDRNAPPPRPPPASPAPSLPPEQHFPVPLIGLHGLLAVTTLVLVLLTALGIGD